MTTQEHSVPMVSWPERGETRSARWFSESGVAPPRRVIVADDRMNADRAYRYACEGTAMLWRGDFNNARALLQAIARRVDAKPDGPKPNRMQRKAAPARAVVADGPFDAPAAGAGNTEGLPKAGGVPKEAFHLFRMAQAQRARILGMLLIPFDAGHAIPLRRAPDLHKACSEARGPCGFPYVSSLRELLGAVGAHQWRRKGVEVAALDDRIHPHYGVFAPVRGEYVDLVDSAPLAVTDLAFDIGTGTGVLAAVLARRGVKRIIATDSDPRALDCARDNLARLGYRNKVEVRQADMFPDGRASLIVCNPPWLPGKPATPLERAVYDPESRMLRAFIAGLAHHLAPGGEGWLVLSDLAEHLHLRSREELTGWFAAAGLAVIQKHDILPRHPKAFDAADPLAPARRAEVTSLWRLAAAPVQTA
jgi:SAM-dependent methyltransferase